MGICRLVGVKWICYLAVSGDEVFLFGRCQRGGVVLRRKGWRKEGSVIREPTPILEEIILMS